MLVTFGALAVVTGGSTAAATTVRAVVDGSVIDSDFDGRGDFTYNDLGSVIVGFNAHFGPGEYRGVYEFDLGEVARCGTPTALLRLNLAGTFADAGDPSLTLTASAGDGALMIEDFAAGSFVGGFPAEDPITYPVSVVDVSTAVRSAVEAGWSHIAFVVRPNPASAAVRGAFLFSSNEIADAYGFAPTVLELECSGPFLSIPAAFAVDATEPAGAAVTFTASATDLVGGPVPATCTPPSGSVFPIGTTTVACVATDSSGNSARASFDLHVRGAAEQLAALADDARGIGPGTSLVDKLGAAQAALEAGNSELACEILAAVGKQVAAQAGKTLTREQAGVLTGRSTRIRALLAC